MARFKFVHAGLSLAYVWLCQKHFLFWPAFAACLLSVKPRIQSHSCNFIFHIIIFQKESLKIQKGSLLNKTETKLRKAMSRTWASTRTFTRHPLGNFMPCSLCQAWQNVASKLHPHAQICCTWISIPNQTKSFQVCAAHLDLNCAQQC